MFQHVSVLVSFIFAIALTHVFSSASQLLLARDRVRYCALLTVSMVNAALGVIINWLGLWELQNIKHWSLAEVLLQLGWVVPNYFSCSLVAMPVSENGPLDMSAFFERQRRVIFSATLALAVMGGLATYLDRNNFQGWKPNDWVGAELLGLLLAIVRCWLVGQSRAGCNGSGLAACSFRTFRFLFSTRSVPNRVP
ncbi:MAG TPA: hypothetical protein VGI59_02100 [Candidatus Udaeobacter sp.]|jgi:hypothetical protein